MFPPFYEESFFASASRARAKFSRGGRMPGPEFDPEPMQLPIEEISLGTALKLMNKSKLDTHAMRIELQQKAQLQLLASASPFRRNEFFPQLGAHYEGIVEPLAAVNIRGRYFLYHFQGEEVNWEREWCHCFRKTDGARLFIRYDSETVIHDIRRNCLKRYLSRRY